MGSCRYRLSCVRRRPLRRAPCIQGRSISEKKTQKHSFRSQIRYVTHPTILSKLAGTFLEVSGPEGAAATVERRGRKDQRTARDKITALERSVSVLLLPDLGVPNLKPVRETAQGHALTMRDCRGTQASGISGRTMRAGMTAETKRLATRSTSTSKALRPRGRPVKGNEALLAQLIIRAARKLFFENGYEKTSTDEVAALAQCSKRTIYARFATKADLFEAVVLDFVAERRSVGNWEALAGLSLREQLIKYSEKTVEGFLRADVRSLYFVIHQEAARFPELVRIAEEAGRKPSTARLVKILESSSVEGESSVPGRTIYCARACATDPLHRRREDRGHRRSLQLRASVRRLFPVRMRKAADMSNELKSISWIDVAPCVSEERSGSRTAFEALPPIAVV